MKVGLLVEGTTDRLAFEILVGRLVGEAPEIVEFRRRVSGMSGVVTGITGACWHFWRQGADAAVLAVDNDDAIPVHDEAHASEAPSECRACTLRRAVPQLPSPPLRVAVAVPVQTLEAWLLVSMGQRLPEELPRAKLKVMAYGSARPTPAVAQRVIRQSLEAVDLNVLGTAAPSFAFFAAQVRSWAVGGALPSR